MYKGALHVHSTYSDGEFTLPELRQTFLSAECSFVCITDHAEHFDRDKLKRYLDECQALSDAQLRFVPGLEYECENRMHILGYGSRLLVDCTAPEDVISHIDEQSAISVIAHPRNEHFSWIERFNRLPQGIEAWNSKYDGKYAPRPETFSLIQRLSGRQPNLHAFYGQDLHWKHQSRELFVVVDSKSSEPGEILSALAAGNYHGQKRDLNLPSSGILPEDRMAQFAGRHKKSHDAWRLAKETKRWFDRAGIQIPESIKSQLRRMF